MTDPDRRQGGFTLLEIMIALAVLAVGAMCVLSTFAAALALHMKREADVRAARVLQEATFEAEMAWNTHVPTRERPLPPPLEERPWSRDDAVLYAISFQPIEGLPAEGTGFAGGIRAIITLREEGSRRPPRVESVVLSRTGFNPEELGVSRTFDEEKKADEMKKRDPYGRSKER